MSPRSSTPRFSTSRFTLHGLCAVLLVCTAAFASAQTSAPTPAPQRAVLVELFTSEGCSSCPPADAQLRQINGKRTAAGQLIVGLSEHVTYWNRLGWTDPFSAQTFTDRQSRYAQRLQLDDVYTPQMVINGREQIVGGNGPALRDALQYELQSPFVALDILGVQPNAHTLDVRFHAGALPGALPGSAPLSLVAVIADDADSTDVRRGENAGRTLDHLAVARSLAHVADVVVAGDGEVQVLSRRQITPPAARGSTSSCFCRNPGPAAYSVPPSNRFPELRITHHPRPASRSLEWPHTSNREGSRARPHTPRQRHRTYTRVADHTLHLFNTLSGQIEPLFAADGQRLRFYCCGPTVYDYGHIGNFRTFLHVDLLRRALRLFGLTPQHVMNVTDVDDKIIRNAGAANLPIGEYSRKYEEAFFEDLDALGMERPEIIARATENIPEMVVLIQRLAAEDIAYQAEDGSWYFRVARDPSYGKLSKKDLEGIEDGARIAADEYDKDAVRDFALWKATKPGETSWPTALGEGRPGWHIECSAMALKYLGDSFDLHAGGEDLMFPHHENEIAQSECATHQTFARHWFHVRFLLVEGKKMSKSEGNFYTLRDLLLKGYKASAIRFLLLSVPYRHQLNFTFDGVRESTNAIDRLRTFAQRMRDGKWPAAGGDEALSAVIRRGHEGFLAALANDLNSAEARAAIFEVIRAVNTAADQNKLTQPDADATLALLAAFDQIFAVLEDNDAELTRWALDWAKAENRLDQADPDLLARFAETGPTDADIDALVAERTQAKRQRNFARADGIRNDLLAKGILLEDGKDGVRWRRK